MARVLIIGAGGVGSVVAHKCAQNPEVFTEIMLASRTVSKCDAIAASIKERTGRIIETARVNADDVPELVALIKRYKPVMVINVALPYQDLTIMDACLEAGVHYMDTANYEPLDVAKFEYKWQWAYQQKFKDAGLMALLGSGCAAPATVCRALRGKPLRGLLCNKKSLCHPNSRQPIAGSRGRGTASPGPPTARSTYSRANRLRTFAGFCNAPKA